MTVDAIEPRLGERRGFDVSLCRVGLVCVLQMRGDLDVTSVAVLEHEFDGLWRTSCRRVVLDLEHLGTIDATGARVLTGLHHYVEARGGSTTVVGANPWVRAVLETTPLLPRDGATKG